MHALTIYYGFALLSLGIGSYYVTNGKSVTALIPAFFGALMVVLGFIAGDPKRRKQSIQAACILALVATVGSASGLIELPTLLMGGQVERSAAVISRSIMALLSLAFFAVCFRSFLKGGAHADEEGLEEPPTTSSSETGDK